MATKKSTAELLRDEVNKPGVITSASLLNFAILQRELAEAKEAVKLLEAKTKPQEQEFIRQIEAGAVVEPGSPLVAIDEASSGRRPKWKEEFTSRLGAAAAAEVIANTPEGKTKSLVITLLAVAAKRARS